MSKRRKMEDQSDHESNDDDDDEDEVEDDDNNNDEVEVEEEVEEEEEEEEEGEEEDLTKLLEPFNKEQLIDLLRTAASSNSKLLEEIHRIADLDPAHRKLFVHGLGWETNSEKLRDFYSQFGDVEESNVVTDKITGKSKGYGFLVFKHRKSAQNALIEPQKKIQNRLTSCQLASSGPVNFSQSINPQQQTQTQTQTQTHPLHSTENLPRKIYVGNVHSEISADKLHAFFSKYGEIEEGPLGLDRLTGKPKGYALFIYKTKDGARKALEEPSKNFEGHQLYCQKATDSNKLKTGPPSHGNAGKASEFGGSGNAGAGGFNMQGGMGMGMVPNVSGVPNAFYGQQFAQGVQPIQAALAVLAAAGQNPAAFGVGSVYPGYPNAQVMPGFGMQGYANPQGLHQASTLYQGGAPTQGGAASRPAGHMGGYAPR
ncbi:hypothetical protein GIB67_026121 [Kingdonia uniflora]|uniref:RRM domain-containing protein n=1 Tax=Kingdonia uniflora TaxID=39325 RepID=A0A7J7M302_9MAGN|nr:hypothetical protein GIB67_026121 [Kingdonia uniflora]